MSSPRTARRLNRILAVVPWLIAHPGAAPGEVVSRFGYADESDLVRDLHLVFVCGLPGYGPGDLIDVTVDEDGIYVDMADYFARPVRLTAPEGLMLLASGSAVIASGAGSPELERAVAKLQAALVPDDASGAVEIDFGPEPALVQPLRLAASERRAVRITYTALATGETSTRVVEPWQVSTSLGNWYLVANCRKAGGERVFRVDRIREAEMLEEQFDPPEHPPPAEIRYTPGVDDARVVLDLSPQAAWVADYYPIEDLGDVGGARRIVFSASDPAVAARLLVRLGRTATVVEGSEAMSAAAGLRDRILERYGAARP